MRNVSYQRIVACRDPALCYGRFFPDFAAQLSDGRRLLIEYKGEQFEAKSSEQEKLDIGREWERRSNGKALFLWAVKQALPAATPPPS